MPKTACGRRSDASAMSDRSGSRVDGFAREGLKFRGIRRHCASLRIDLHIDMQPNLHRHGRNANCRVGSHSTHDPVHRSTPIRHTFTTRHSQATASTLRHASSFRSRPAVTRTTAHAVAVGGARVRASGAVGRSELRDLLVRCRTRFRRSATGRTGYRAFLRHRSTTCDHRKVGRRTAARTSARSRSAVFPRRLISLRCRSEAHDAPRCGR